MVEGTKDTDMHGDHAAPIDNTLPMNVYPEDGLVMVYEPTKDEQCERYITAQIEDRCPLDKWV